RSYAADISLHVLAQARQASAHSRQCSMPISACFSHSSAHRSQISAHILHSSLLNCPSILITFTAASHMIVHSKFNWIHFLRCSRSFSSKQAAAHWLQNTAHSPHASIQS